MRKSLYCYKIQFIFFHLTPVTRCIGHAWPSTNHFKCWCQNWFAQSKNLRAYRGLPRFRKKGRVEKTFISISFVSIVTFLLLIDSLFWHGLASLNLVISTQHHCSAQIDFDIHVFKLFLFSHALRYHHVFGIKWKKITCSWQDNEA